MYRLALGRDPDAEEVELAREFVGEGEDSQWTALGLALMNINEFVYID